MSGRVLSTPEAESAIQKLQQIINGPLIEQIEALNREGRTLSDQNVWDGQLAGEFRNGWPETDRSLRKVREELEELRASVQRINENIMTAGGNR
jgi:uncharacterized protein YukE